MLIDSSYFTKGYRRILNATLGTSAAMPTPNSVEVNNAIEGYIGECQEEFLRLALGSPHGNKAHNYLVCKDEGDSFEVDVYEEIFEKLREPFADYVFFHILRSANDQSTITGLVRLKCANTYVSPIRRQVEVWNRMVEKNERFLKWSRSEECPLKDIDVDDEMLTRINTLNI